LLGWSSKIEFGQQIDYRENGGKIAELVSFAIKCKNPPLTYFSSAGSQSVFGLK
jgi:hypothetical protein